MEEEIFRAEQLLSGGHYDVSHLGIVVPSNKELFKMKGVKKDFSVYLLIYFISICSGLIARAACGWTLTPLKLVALLVIVPFVLIPLIYIEILKGTLGRSNGHLLKCMGYNTVLYKGEQVYELRK